MKRSIVWHMQCLENQRAHYSRLLEQIERLKQDHARGLQEIMAYDAQIIRAQEKGLPEFDREKFGKRREPQGERSE